MTIEKIMEYVSSNPRSVNKTVIRGMIEELVKDVESAGAVDVPEVPQIDVDEIVIKKNGVFRAPEGKVYNKVIVNVKEMKND